MQGGSTNNRCPLPQIGRLGGTLETFGVGLSSVCVCDSSGGGSCNVISAVHLALLGGREQQVTNGKERH